MSTSYKLTELAEQDLLDIWIYASEEFGYTVADRVFEQMHDAFKLLAERPQIGQARPELAPKPYRIWPVGPSLIA